MKYSFHENNSGNYIQKFNLHALGKHLPANLIPTSHFISFHKKGLMYIQ